MPLVADRALRVAVRGLVLAVHDGVHKVLLADVAVAVVVEPSQEAQHLIGIGTGGPKHTVSIAALSACIAGDDGVPKRQAAEVLAREAGLPQRSIELRKVEALACEARGRIASRTFGELVFCERIVAGAQSTDKSTLPRVPRWPMTRQSARNSSFAVFTLQAPSCSAMAARSSPSLRIT